MPASLLPAKSIEPSVYEELEKNLVVLSQKAVNASVKDLGEALELARGFEKWTQLARASCGEWSHRFYLQAQEMVRDLQAGWPVARTMEVLLRALLQAHRFLEKEQEGESEKETDIPISSVSTNGSFKKKNSSDEVLFIRPEDQGLFQLFLQEAPSILAEVQSDLLYLSAGQKTDISRVYQLFHILQGQWGFLGFFQLRILCLHAVSFLEPYLAGESRLIPGKVDFLLRALSSCRSQMEHLQKGLAKGWVEITDASSLLAEIDGQLQVPAEPQVPASQEMAGASLFQVDNFFKVGDEEMEKLLDLLGELALSQSSFMEETLAAGLKGKSVMESARITKLTRQLRDSLLAQRMVPVKPLFDQMTEIMAGLSHQAGKMVYLTAEGGDSELDKQLVSQLLEPLTQLLKNAVDHGFEPAEERIKAGKPAEGTLKLKANHQAGAFLLEVEDDGRGLNLEKLRQKGLALGILKSEKESPARVMEMIFKPGVTTLESPEEGRGVGLDKVEEAIEAMHGSIRVQSRPGYGCKFIIKIPKSQALVEGLVAEAARKRYLFPLSQVRKITHPAPMGSTRDISPEEALLPVIDLAQWLGGESPKGAAKFSIHVESGSNQFRVLVDEVHGKQQALVRKLGAKEEGRGIRGGAVLADGKMGWILDTRELVKAVGG
jgi:chemotaxis protein histidine kinase CheA